MDATEILRRLLDERGVEYRTHGTTGRTWFEVGSISWFICERENGNFTADAVFLTPEQTIAATLGRGECQIETTENWLPAERYHRCKECGAFFAVLDASHDIPPRYCPNCGRKVVDPTTNDVDAEVAE